MASKDLLKLSPQAQQNLVNWAQKILENHKQAGDLYLKYEFVDVAYARYKAAEAAGGNGEDTVRAELEDYDINLDEITLPVVVSHVDSYVGYFSDVFLSGYPIFPVVSSPQTRIEAEMLQAVFDKHAVQGRYARQMLMSFYDDAKYNLSALEVDWCPQSDYSLLNAYEAAKSNQKIKPENVHFNKVQRIDPYNLIFDKSVLPPDVPVSGEFAGYVELISHAELRKRLSYYEKSMNGYNTAQAQFSTLDKRITGIPGYGYYREPPQISNFVTKEISKKGLVLDWDAYLSGTGKKANIMRRNYSNCYESVTLYGRIVPSLLGITGIPGEGTPQVWKFVFINHEKLVYAARQFNVFDTIPMYFGMPFEDGLGLQSQSVAEGAVAFQEGASKLFSIRLNAARRSVMDRALYDPQMVNPSHIDAAYPAPKIPIRDNSLLSGKKIQDAYHQIPFDSRGTETVVQDMTSMVGMADRMNGINQPMQGQFQKGNKSRKEWEDTMAGASNRLRLRALSLEYQQFIFIKEQVKWNIYQHGAVGNFQNTQTGRSYQIDAKILQQIKDKISTFQLADGFLPSDKLASTEVLAQGMQLIASSPVLQQAWGPGLPQMFAHLMSLGGVKGLEQYMPEQAQQTAQQPPAAPPAAPPVV